MTFVVAAGIPNPVSLVTDAAGDAARRMAAPIVDGIASSLLRWLGEACRDVGRELVGVLSGSATPQFDRGWWASPQGRELMGTVTALAAVLAVVFVLLAVLQGLIGGDPAGMLRTALGHVPLSALGVGVVVGVTEVLLRVTDEATALVTRDTPEHLGRFVEGFGLDASVMTGGLAAVVLMIVFLLGALLVWAELLVRSALVYLLVAFAPLVLAARIWPAARGIFRRLCELGLALIVSKLAIGLALALGAAALAGGDQGAPGGGMSLAGLLGGATLMGLAAFTPFVVLRLIPLVEMAVMAQGISRSPLRGAQTAAMASAYPARLTRMAGGAGPARALGPGRGSSLALPTGAAAGTALASGGMSSTGAHRHGGAGSGPGRQVAAGRVGGAPANGPGSSPERPGTPPSRPSAPPPSAEGKGSPPRRRRPPQVGS